MASWATGDSGGRCLGAVGAWRGGDGGSQAAAKQNRAAPSLPLTALLLHPLPPMGARRGPPLLPAALLFLSLFFLLAVRADTNVTVDDINTTAIIYDPPASWAESSFNSLDAGGSHATTDDPDATATFSFTGARFSTCTCADSANSVVSRTGTAIYYWAPLWPFRVTTALALDGAAPVLVDMRDTSQPLDREGGETVQSAPLWAATGLDDTLHTLVISVGVGEGIAVVDQLQCVLFLS